jgi:3-dehydroquinate synthase
MNEGEGGSVLVTVRSGSGSGAYPILVERGVHRRLPHLLRDFAPGHRYAFISDDLVGPMYGEPLAAATREAGFDASLFVFPAGEASKTRKQWSILTDAMLAASLGRDTVVVAVGGGVVGDLAGFVAATFLRGVPVVQVPTSLVAMIDSSIGGKTGVDVKAGKNLVGAFHPPVAVIVDPEAARTLSPRERGQGLAEAMKHGAILDEAYLVRLQEHAVALLDGEVAATEWAVARSVELKADVVSRDEREGGLREILNFGHTFGHAMEAASGYTLRHGDAVAAGMVLECRLGEALGVTEAGTSSRLARALSGLGLGSIPSMSGGARAVLPYLKADKKARRGRPRFVLLERPGKVASGEEWSRAVPEGAAEAVLLQSMGGEA